MCVLNHLWLPDTNCVTFLYLQANILFYSRVSSILVKCSTQTKQVRSDGGVGSLPEQPVCKKGQSQSGLLRQFCTFIIKDSKTFSAILNVNAYGDEQVVTSENVDYVQKRMGTWLYNVEKIKRLNGKGKLTKALIKI